MKRIFILSYFLLCLMLACKHQMVAPGTSTTEVPVSNSSDSVCFNSNILPLYVSYCGSSGCHDAATAREDVVLTDYFDIMKGIRANNPGGSKYYSVLSRSMPPSGHPKMTSIQTATILKWINQGATNTVCSSTNCDTTQTTYTNGISALFSTYCIGCHGIAPGSGNVVLSDYNSAKAAGTTLKANFLNAIHYTSTNTAMNMPPVGQLSNCQVTQITKWINNGCPQ